MCPVRTVNLLSQAAHAVTPGLAALRWLEAPRLDCGGRRSCGQSASSCRAQGDERTSSMSQRVARAIVCRMSPLPLRITKTPGSRRGRASPPWTS
jgi:hypothetical protein